VGGANDGGGRELRDRNVIGVAVGAEWVERDDHVRPNAANVSRDLLDGFVRVRAVQLRIQIIEERDLAHTQRCRGGTQLGLARTSNDRGAWRDAGIIEAAALT